MPLARYCEESLGSKLRLSYERRSCDCVILLVIAEVEHGSGCIMMRLNFDHRGVRDVLTKAKVKKARFAI